MTAIAIAIASSLSLHACRCDSPTIGGPALQAPTAQVSEARVRNTNSVPLVVRDPSRIPGTYQLVERADASDH